MPHHLTEDCSPDGAGPYLLRIVGFWGWAKRAKLDIYDVDVYDAGRSLPKRKLRGNQHLVAEQPVPDIIEDVDPTDGLDVELGKQLLKAPTADARHWTVTDVQ